MILVLDSNAIIGLCKGKALELLPGFCSQVWIAPATYEEVVNNGQGRPGAAELAQAVQNWLGTKDPSLQSRAEFGSLQNPNDRDVLALAFEIQSDYLVTEDSGMRQVAASRNLAVLTIPELLLIAKGVGHLNPVKPVLDRMRSSGPRHAAGCLRPDSSTSRRDVTTLS